MKSHNLQEFRKELNATERFGCMAIRDLCNEALEKWGRDCVQLADLADIFIQEADLIDLYLLETGQRQVWKDEELSGTYLMLYQSICDYAKNNLSQKDYHYYCERQSKTNKYWY